MLYVPKNVDMAPMSNLWHEIIGREKFKYFLIRLNLTLKINCAFEILSEK
jgi:hypothetical protein